MSVNIGGSTSNTPRIQHGVDGGVHKKQSSSSTADPCREEAVGDLSKSHDHSLGNSTPSGPGNKANTAFADQKSAASESAENKSETSFTIKSPSAFDAARLLVRQLFSNKEESDEIKSSQTQTYADAAPRNSSLLPNLAFNGDATYAMNTGNFLGTNNNYESLANININADKLLAYNDIGTKSVLGTDNNGKVLDTNTSTTKVNDNGAGIGVNNNTAKPLDNNANNGRVSYGDTNNGLGIKNDSQYQPFTLNDTSRVVLNTRATGPLNVELNPLQAPNGDIIRNQFGQPLVQTMTIKNDAGKLSVVDLREIDMARISGIPQQGLVLDTQAMQMNRDRGLIILSRQDGTGVALEPYTAPDGSTQARIVEIHNRDLEQKYGYDNRNQPGLARLIETRVHDTLGGPDFMQMRARRGDSNVFDLYEYQMINGQKVWTRPSEIEMALQARIDGQIAYQRVANPQELAMLQYELSRNNGPISIGGQQISREEILNHVKNNDKPFVLANDLASAKRLLLEVTKGQLFGGDDAKTAHYIDMYVTRIRDHRKNGFYTDSDDQLAAALRGAAETFTAQRTGEAAKLTKANMVGHMEDMLRTMGDPPKFVNQGQVGSCFVVSLIIAAMYTASHKVMEKWKSILTTGQTADGKAKFTAAELNKKNHMGETYYDFLTVSACYKKRAGPNAKLGGMNSGTDDMQASREYKWLTDGLVLPMSAAHYKKYGVQMGFTPGHARTYIAVMQGGKLTKYFNNTWDGAGEKPSPIPRVETLVC